VSELNRRYPQETQGNVLPKRHSGMAREIPKTPQFPDVKGPVFGKLLRRRNVHCGILFNCEKVFQFAT